MKLKTTKKNLKEGYYHIISIGYCNAQYLLKYEKPFSYCARAEGWACDNYDIEETLISTGYAPIAATNTIKDYAMVQEYEKKAITIATSYSLTWQEQKEEIRKLLSEFVKKCKGE